MSNSVPINSVVTSFEVIELMHDANSPISVTWLAKVMQTNKPRIHRHLKTLELLGYVRQNDSSLYFLTSKIRRFGRAGQNVYELLSIARPFLMELRDRTKQTVTIGEVEAEGIRNLEILRAGGAVEITSAPGAFFEFYSSSQGKVALAFGESGLLDIADRRAQINDAPYEKDALLLELEEIRQREWAVAPGAILPGINALAAPILNERGELVGTISILGSIEQVGPVPSDDLISELKNTVRLISLELVRREQAA